MKLKNLILLLLIFVLVRSCVEDGDQCDSDTTTCKCCSGCSSDNVCKAEEDAPGCQLAKAFFVMILEIFAIAAAIILAVICIIVCIVVCICKKKEKNYQNKQDRAAMEAHMLHFSNDNSVAAGGRERLDPKQKDM